mgnify:CR=1 FL=1
MGRIKNLVRNINYLTKHSLWDQREDDIVYLTNKILDDGIYEYDLKLHDFKRLKVLKREESIDLIISSGESFVRFGDGEINLMKGIDQPFQRHDKELVQRLYHILSIPQQNLLVGLNEHYFEPGYKHTNYDYNRRHAYDFRQFFIENCDMHRTYIDGQCTFYEFGNNGEETVQFWKKWKEAFKDKDIVIICGEGILDKLQYDVFEYAKSRKYIYGPSRHAWCRHDEIIGRIKKEISTDQLLIFILGMAGKAMIPEVTAMGYCAWDIGHLTKSYNAYMNNMQPTNENIRNFYAPD